MSEEVSSWLDKAREDSLAAAWLLQEESPVVLPAVFHIQQSAEKLIKAVLVSKGVRVPQSHDLVYLA